MNFLIGQKVVYVGGERLSGENYAGRLGLIKGHVYTIREVDPTYIRYFGMVGVRVCEAATPKVLWNGRMIEPAVLAFRFRPVTERKTDISVFTAMLTPKKARKPVRV